MLGGEGGQTLINRWAWDLNIHGNFIIAFVMHPERQVVILQVEVPGTLYHWVRHQGKHHACVRISLLAVQD